MVRGIETAQWKRVACRKTTESFPLVPKGPKPERESIAGSYDFCKWHTRTVELLSSLINAFEVGLNFDTPCSRSIFCYQGFSALFESWHSSTRKP